MVGIIDQVSLFQQAVDLFPAQPLACFDRSLARHEMQQFVQYITPRRRPLAGIESLGELFDQLRQARPP